MASPGRHRPTGNRRGTTLAVVLGGALGAAAALVEPAPRGSSATAPFEPASALEGRTPEEPSLPVSRPSPPLPTPAPPVPTKAVVVPNTETIDQHVLACARNDPSQCLDAAKLLALAGREDDAKLHLQLSIQKLAAACNKRRGGACWRLAEMYADGLGVELNEETASALRTRGTELCRARATPGCPTPGAPSIVASPKPTHD